MPSARRPRVAAIGLSDAQVASIAPFCGELRQADSSEDYVEKFSWTETDAMVSSALEHENVDSSVNVMTMGSSFVSWSDVYVGGGEVHRHYAHIDPEKHRAGADSSRVLP